MAASPQPRFKTWNKNTNWDNLGNWDGYERNCSKNIYSFPTGMDRMVISIRPNTTISTKQIILPRNGHLVFQKGSTVLLNSPSETCQGTGESFFSNVLTPINYGPDLLPNTMAEENVNQKPGVPYDLFQRVWDQINHLGAAESMHDLRKQELILLVCFWFILLMGGRKPK